MKKYRFYLVSLAVLLIIPLMVSVACNLGTTPETPTPVVPPTSSQKPTIQIKSPLNNADIVVNKAITVEVSSSHPDGVTRVELRANELQVDSKVSQNPLGDPEFSAFLTYTPTTVGALTLTAIAYRGVTASDPATVTISVVAGQAQVTPTEAIVVPTIDTDPSCRARVDVSGLNFRQGPGVNYPVVTVLGLGTVIHLTGRLGDNTWWQGTYNNQFGWLSANFITLLGFCTNIPIANPPPSPAPTLAPSNTPGPTANPTAALPDLIIANFTGPTQVMLSQGGTATATYQITVQNIGSAGSSQVSLGLTLPDSTLRTIGTIPALAPGQSAVFTTDVTFSAPGTARLTAIADLGNQLAEKDETNNLRSLDIVIIKPTPLPGPTVTPVTPTATRAATSTSTATPTVLPTRTSTPTSISTATETMTATVTMTTTSTATSTSTLTPTP